MKIISFDVHERDNKRNSPFPEEVFPKGIFPRDIFPWMDDDDESSETEEIENNE